MPNFVRVASLSELAPNQCKVVEVGQTPVALFNVGGSVFATHNTCLHRGGSLGEGELDGNVVTCPLHGWQYDVKTGVSQTSPDKKLACYAVQVEGDDIKVAVD